MKPIQTLLTLLLVVTLLLSGCGSSSQAESPTTQTTPTEQPSEPSEEMTSEPEETTEPSEEAATPKTEETEVATKGEQETSVEGELHTVKMGSDSGQLIFVPEKLEIEPGDTVKWVMNKVPPHNVIFEGDHIPKADKALAKEISHQKLLSTPGASYKTTFSEDMPSGVYPYYCQPHRAAGMAGEIIIKD